jgi:hypothetical protein
LGNKAEKAHFEMRYIEQNKRLIMKHLIEFGSYLNETTKEYDHILDLYNKGGVNKMWPSEVDSLKSGGTQGSSFRAQMPDELIEIYDEVMSYLDAKHINYTFEETWAPTFGMVRYLDLPYSDEVFNKLESMFPKNKTAMPFVQKRDGGRCFVYVMDPEDYKDIIGHKQ